MGKRFLIVQLGAFGDCLYATTIAKQIKTDYKDSHITWAIVSAYKSILYLNPYVDVIWELSVSYKDISFAWLTFEKELKQSHKNKEFDEIILSQIAPKNWIRFKGTIRNSILQSYKRSYNIDCSPVVRLSTFEVEKVKDFAERHKLLTYKHIILFECSPSSDQSKMSLDKALFISKKICVNHKDVCFIISSNNKFSVNNEQIIDGSELTFRENAELTKYCTFLIGCSSGITWLSTSDWAKKLPMLQILNAETFMYIGIDFDLKINKIEHSNVIEIEYKDFNKIELIIDEVIKGNFFEAKKKFHVDFRPTKQHLYKICHSCIYMNYKFKDFFKLIIGYIWFNFLKKNYFWFNPLDLLLRIYIKKKYSEIRFDNSIINSNLSLFFAPYSLIN